jgi:NF-X1-type zinc finger protein NFXL1
MICSHNCTLLCHSGKCSLESECQAKVVVKCACKTLKKNFICNKLRNEKDNGDFLIYNDKENKFLLKCNYEKCAVKKSYEQNEEYKKVLDQVESEMVDSNVKKRNKKKDMKIEQQKSNYYSIYMKVLALIALFIAVFIYYCYYL